MKKYRYISCILGSVLVAFLMPVIGFANSSWRWLTDVTPFYILPVVMLATIIAEVGLISRQTEQGKIIKVICFVFVANLISFVLPYLIEFSQALMVVDSFSDYLDKGPTYIVGLIYLILTLISEVPVVYNGLKKDSKNKKKLLLSIFISNGITTVVVAFVERIVCRGSW